MTPSPTKRTSPLRREEIVDAAREILRYTDLDGLSLRRLAASLGVTAPALYAHVEDKGDLLAAVAERGLADLVEAFEQVDARDPIDRLHAYGRAYVEQAMNDPELFRVMFVFRPGWVPMPEMDNELDAATTAFDQPQVAITEAMERRDIHPDRDPVLTAMSLWTVAHGLASVFLLGASGGEVLLPDNAQELIEDVLRVTLVGMREAPQAG
jgi:AcrR family transcriptional regulator